MRTSLNPAFDFPVSDGAGADPAAVLDTEDSPGDPTAELDAEDSVGAESDAEDPVTAELDTEDPLLCLLRILQDIDISHKSSCIIQIQIPRTIIAATSNEILDIACTDATSACCALREVGGVHRRRANACCILSIAER